MLMMAALLGTLTPLIDGVFRASGQFATGTLAIHLARLVEWTGGIAGLLADGSMAAAAGGMLLARIAATIGARTP